MMSRAIASSPMNRILVMVMVVVMVVVIKEEVDVEEDNKCEGSTVRHGACPACCKCTARTLPSTTYLDQHCNGVCIIVVSKRIQAASKLSLPSRDSSSRNVFALTNSVLP